MLKCVLSGFLFLFFVSFGAPRRDCILVNDLTTCGKQCCGMDDNSLRCLDTCDGWRCTRDVHCDEGCCIWPSAVCGSCKKKRGETSRLKLNIGLGIAVSVLGLIVVCGLVWYNIRRRRRRPGVVLASPSPVANGTTIVSQTTTTNAQPFVIAGTATATDNGFQQQSGHEVLAMRNIAPPPYSH